MSPTRVPTQINHVSLRVRDLKRSAAFYCDLFGLTVRPAVPPGDSACICAAPLASPYMSFGVALVQGLPVGADPIGLDHVSLEVPKEDDVDEIYCAAKARGAPATEPRLYGGYYQTFVFDPDGYKIEVLARQAEASASEEEAADSLLSRDAGARDIAPEAWESGESVGPSLLAGRM